MVGLGALTDDAGRFPIPDGLDLQPLHRCRRLPRAVSTATPSTRATRWSAASSPPDVVTLIWWPLSRSTPSPWPGDAAPLSPCRTSAIGTVGRRILLANVVAEVGIVVTGGLVRLTGSGLGCPTWPECTDGSLVPVADPVRGLPQVHRVRQPSPDVRGARRGPCGADRRPSAVARPALSRRSAWHSEQPGLVRRPWSGWPSASSWASSARRCSAASRCCSTCTRRPSPPTSCSRWR